MRRRFRSYTDKEIERPAIGSQMDAYGERYFITAVAESGVTAKTRDGDECYIPFKDIEHVYSSHVRTKRNPIDSEHVVSGRKKRARYGYTKRGIRDEVWKEGDRIYFKLWNTIVVEATPDIITLDTKGWRTVTTKDRINRYLGQLGSSFDIWSDRGVWYIGKGYSRTDRVAFWDGMQIDRQIDSIIKPVGRTVEQKSGIIAAGTKSKLDQIKKSVRELKRRIEFGVITQEDADLIYLALESRRPYPGLFMLSPGTRGIDVKIIQRSLWAILPDVRRYLKRKAGLI